VDKKLARKNMHMGVALFILMCVLLGSTFVWAAFYLGAVVPKH
jgi:hypothetical protein